MSGSRSVLASAIAAFALLVPAATASPAAEGPAGGTEVICVSMAKPRPVLGRYAVRPHHCNFHSGRRPALDKWTISLRRIRWLHWGSRGANGRVRGRNREGEAVQVKVRLGLPFDFCGHRVFTGALFHIVGTRVTLSMALDRALPTKPCRRARDPDASPPKRLVVHRAGTE